MGASLAISSSWGMPLVPSGANLHQYRLYIQQSCQRGRETECGVGNQGLLPATPAHPSYGCVGGPRHGSEHKEANNF